MSASSNASVIHSFSPSTPWLDTQDLCLDSDYTGHLLIDTPRPRKGDEQAKTAATFDDSTVSNVRPWWNHLLPKINTSDSTLTTADDMLKTFIDPYASLRHRTTHPLLEELKQEERSATDAGSMVTPPGQLYQRYEYDDTILAMPLVSLPSIRSMIPDVQEDRNGLDTPKELIEAAVAALMASSTGAAATAAAANVRQEGVAWNTPASATFMPNSAVCATHGHPTFPGMDQDMAATGPIRRRAYTLAEPLTSWYPSNGGDGLLSPDPFHIDIPVDGESPLTGSGMHQCHWIGCNQVLPSASALTLHVNRAHIARRQPAHRCLWQGCNRAAHVFRHRDKILIHIRLHTNDRPFSCDAPGCGKHFSRADSLEAHKKVHSVEGRVWQCRMVGCSRTYFHAKSLKKHERSAHDLDLEL